MFQSSRGSLSEDVLVNELTRPGLFGNLEDTESNDVENQQNPISFHPNSPKVCMYIDVCSIYACTVHLL